MRAVRAGLTAVALVLWAGAAAAQAPVDPWALVESPTNAIVSWRPPANATPAGYYAYRHHRGATTNLGWFARQPGAAVQVTRDFDLTLDDTANCDAKYQVMAGYAVAGGWRWHGTGWFPLTPIAPRDAPTNACPPHAHVETLPNGQRRVWTLEWHPSIVITTEAPAD